MQMYNVSPSVKMPFSNITNLFQTQETGPGRMFLSGNCFGSTIRYFHIYTNGLVRWIIWLARLDYMVRRNGLPIIPADRWRRWNLGRWQWWQGCLHHLQIFLVFLHQQDGNHRLHPPALWWTGRVCACWRWTCSLWGLLWGGKPSSRWPWNPNVNCSCII